ncbi:histone H4 transcription factor-like [Oppia nitens]|uniref:histone H4 transcription factor-like n=1 Tax=Oppia nitens TaxID=1686743 RepID=UPI0023DABC53|nr:histone H4 transcription factor-like [Oppia nitens]
MSGVVCRKRCRQPNEDQLELFCEWSDCHKVFNDLTIYLQHLHQNHSKEDQTNCDNQSLSCQWIGCEENHFDNYSQFCLHVSYHGFHQKLMSYGLQIMKTLGESISCQMDSSARNSLPELPNMFVCGWDQCFTEFIDSESFYRHVDTHAVDDVQIPSLSKDELKRTKYAKCLWINCDSAVKSRSHLREHLRTHTQEKLIACPSCGAMYCNKTKFVDHLYRQTDNNGNNKNDSLTLHVSKVTDDQSMTTLTIQVPQTEESSTVGINSQTTSSLLIQNLNSENELMLIDLADPSALQSVTTINTIVTNKSEDKSKYICPQCDRIFGTQSLLREHFRCHNNKYKCNVCQMTTSSPSALKHHMTYRHNNERPFSCQFCDSRFKSRSDLRRHIDTHNEEPPFKCSICNFESRCVHTYSKHHKETHLAFKCQYVCNECDKSFSRGNNLTRHLITIHKYVLPVGCSRFQYCKQEDGSYRLSTFIDNNS